MTRFRVLVVVLIVCLFATSGLFAGSGAKRWAGRGAAGGAILGLLVGGDLGGAAATSENSDFSLAGYWIEALVTVDRRDQEVSEQRLGKLVELDDDVDTSQQASLLADQAVLEIRETRTAEGISCTR